MPSPISTFPLFTGFFSFSPPLPYSVYFHLPFATINPYNCPPFLFFLPPFPPRLKFLRLFPSLICLFFLLSSSPVFYSQPGIRMIVLSFSSVLAQFFFSSKVQHLSHSSLYFLLFSSSVFYLQQGIHIIAQIFYSFFTSFVHHKSHFLPFSPSPSSPFCFFSSVFYFQPGIHIIVLRFLPFFLLKLLLILRPIFSFPLSAGFVSFSLFTCFRRIQESI